MNYQQSAFKRHRSDRDFSQSFAYKMAAEINWHVYGTKLRHRRRTYSSDSTARPTTSEPVADSASAGRGMIDPSSLFPPFVSSMPPCREIQLASLRNDVSSPCGPPNGFTRFELNKVSPRGRRDDMPPSMAVRRWQKSRRIYVRPRWLSCRQPACL